ncbi:hypothetical protein BB558_007167, partial [Smittium angustum]
MPNYDKVQYIHPEVESHFYTLFTEQEIPTVVVSEIELSSQILSKIKDKLEQKNYYAYETTENHT